MKSYPIPLERTRTEIRVKNSRFIATLAPVFSVVEAKAFIKEIKTEFSDASHNVPCYIVGFEPSMIAHTSDDGEPSGTAGRPALAVLQGSGLGDVAVVVTRYFGGTKLGTGGLVRAHGEAGKDVLAHTQRANGRASGREREENPAVAGSFKKKTIDHILHIANATYRNHYEI